MRGVLTCAFSRKVGNKCDLESQRCVSKEEGETLSKKLKCKFLEASAKTKTNVHEAFHELVRDIKDYKRKHEAAPAPVKEEAKKKRFLCMLL